MHSLDLFLLAQSHVKINGDIYEAQRMKKPYFITGNILTTYIGVVNFH